MITHVVPRSCENPGESEADMHTGSYCFSMCKENLHNTQCILHIIKLITKYCEQDANPMHVHNYNIFILDIAI